MAISLVKILYEVWDEKPKNVLTSSPRIDSIKKFHEVTQKLMGILENSKTIERTQLYNTDEGTNMFKPSIINKGDMIQHIGEYSGENFKNFTQKLMKLYEKAGFNIEIGYGSDDVKGFEVKESNGEVVGEVDFLTKNSIPNYGDTIIIKHKKK